MSKNLAVKSLDFDQIKSSLKDFLKQQSEFSDYNFEGSGMNVLLDTLSYNTHLIGFYTHMLANESFVNSASLIGSMNSHAKGFNYIPKSMKSSKATVKIQYLGGSVQPQFFHIPRGIELSSNSNSTDTRKFIITDDVYITNQGDLSNPDFTSQEILVSEGVFNSIYYTVDTLQYNQRYIIDDEFIDIDSLKIKIFQNQGDVDFEPWTLASDLMEINKESKVYYLSVNEDNKYEFFFGNDVYGSKPNNNNFVEVSYVSTSGYDGNGATEFSLVLPVNDWSTTIETIIQSEGGLNRESIDELRFNIPYHYRRQNRLVTVDDYKNIILSEYRNVNSINVWGGESHTPVTYGTVFVCIKPKFGQLLSNSGKNLIKTIIKKYNMPTIEIEIIDPDYLYVNLEVETLYNPLNTTLGAGEMQSIVLDSIVEYDSEYLSKFNALYSSANLANHVKSKEDSILSTQTSLKFQRKIKVIENSNNIVPVEFTNEIIKYSIFSNEFKFRGNKSSLYDVDGIINIKYFDVIGNIWKNYDSEEFGFVDYESGKVIISGVEFNGFYGNDTTFNLTATPIDRDFRTITNNIIVIDNINVTIVKDYES